MRITFASSDDLISSSSEFKAWDTSGFIYAKVLDLSSVPYLCLTNLGRSGCINFSHVRTTKFSKDGLTVPQTPKNVFRQYKFPFSPDHHCEKIIAVAIFVNFLRIFKVYNFAHFHVHDRGIAENGTSWLLTSFRE